MTPDTPAHMRQDQQALDDLAARRGQRILPAAPPAYAPERQDPAELAMFMRGIEAALTLLFGPPGPPGDP